MSISFHSALPEFHPLGHVLKIRRAMEGTERYAAAYALWLLIQVEATVLIARYLIIERRLVDQPECQSGRSQPYYHLVALPQRDHGSVC